MSLIRFYGVFFLFLTFALVIKGETNSDEDFQEVNLLYVTRSKTILKMFQQEEKKGAAIRHFMPFGAKISHINTEQVADKRAGYYTNSGRFPAAKYRN